ncbi:MAG: dicarboxylate/amino acid:cation symporter [Alphaproteobacteria bacterium]
MSDQEQSPRGKRLDQSSQDIMDQKLWLKILIGMALGIATGYVLSPDGLALLPVEQALVLAEWLGIPGVLFLGLIKMVIVPLIICSIILGISESGNMEFLRKIGLLIVPYFILTTAISITIGLFLVTIINPGNYIDQSLVQNTLSSEAVSSIPETRFDDLTIPQRIENILPTNPARAQVERNMLQIVIASIIVGIALITIPQGSARPLKDLCISGQIITMKIISWAMIIAPYAVFGLLADITIKTGLSALISVGVYAATVLAGLACMVAVYLVMIGAFSKLRVRDFLSGIKEAQLLAFSTSSSAATMPFSIKAAEENLKTRQSVSRFVIPLGATINMDGTALYQAVAAVFLCQVFGIDLTLGQTVLLLVTTVGASIGTPATPGVGLVVLATILSGLGVPAEGIALIIGVDRLLDMCRTTVNVTGDLTATAIMDRWVK